MRHYAPRQREADKRWDYTVDLRDGGAQPIGYCCQYREIDPKIIPISEEEQAKYRDTAHKHHTDGHETAAEACECYKQYLLDHLLRLNQNMSDQQQRCRICGVWTTGYAGLQTDLFVLCPEHNTRESVEAIFEAPAEMWIS